MNVIVARYKDIVVGVYTDINLAKRAAKERLPHAFNKVSYMPFDIDDGIKHDQIVSEKTAGKSIQSAAGAVARTGKW